MPGPGDIDNSYPTKLSNIGLRICGVFKGAKRHHTLECFSCGHRWTATPVSKLQAHKKWGTNGCPACHLIRETDRKNISRANNISRVKSRGLEIISDWSGQLVTDAPKESIPIDVTVKNIKCGHTFTSSSKNLLSRNVSCPICAREYKNGVITASSKARSKHWALSASEWKKYRSEVTKLTRISYRSHHPVINPSSLPAGRAGTEGAYHLDHIVPVRYCFDNNIPAEICSHWSNLQMLNWRDNVGSRDKLKEGLNVPEIFADYIS